MNSGTTDQQLRGATLSESADSQYLVVSNREPYRHDRDGTDITVDRPNGGLTSGLDGAMRRLGGTWIAWGDGDADREVVDDENRVQVPPDADEDQYTLERVWLSEEEQENYYLGFSNRVLWPVCHSALTKIESERQHWEAYRDVNQRFADTVAERVDEESVVWLQDYHFGLAPSMIRSQTEHDPAIAHFWHIPWPGPDAFRACPHGEEILRGLLGNDLLGFHVDRYCENFLRCVDELIPMATVDVDAGIVHQPDGRLTVRSFPLGVEADRIQKQATEAASHDRFKEFADEHGIDADGMLALGVDRLDYTKGIPERLQALERLLEEQPNLRESFTYVQVGSESRSEIPAYEQVQAQVAEAVERINDRFGTGGWQPVVYETGYVSNETLYALYREADAALVSPIRDGMNLVAQEYVAAQAEGPGVLVLSEQAGIHDRIGDDVLSVTPQNTDEFASAIHEALTMSDTERERRMTTLRREIQRNDLESWTEAMLDEIAVVDASRNGR
ncbi:alpha,alpha-trehalose-phosphate synthase (UDP-forming) [Haloarcula amylovorans]|uniref:alpha,alpha-trehalose-phosphate synthase (UDP-forming) n=1 Tax=Haloarcula amylovorans TaxID=2562280 RepID=UPI0010767358|nr:trehalose-6-phosphate synthase [Halomicroarcula amylolytica]